MVSPRVLAFPVALAALAAGCGGGGGPSPTAATTTSASSPSSTSTESTAQTTTTGPSTTASPSGGDGLGAFSCTEKSGGDPTAVAQLTAVRVAHQSGYDRATFEFGPSASGERSGVPGYRLTPQSSTRFVKDPSGQTLVVEGTAGLAVVMRMASGVDLTVTPAHQTYTGSLDLKPALPAVREVAETGDFERVLSWAIGLAQPACTRVLTFTNPARIAIDVQTP